MAEFPALWSGAGVSLPVRRVRVLEGVQTRNSSGYGMGSDGEGQGWMEWDLVYRELTRGEAAALEDFFEEREGLLKAFTFADPMANLVAWSEDLAQGAWVKGAGVTVSPVSGGWEIANGGAGWGGVTQSVAWSGMGCGSVVAESGTRIRVERGGLSSEWLLGGGARECFVSGEGPGEFRLLVGSGESVRVSKVQLRNCVGVTEYVRSEGRSGVYAESYFGEQGLEVRCVGWDRYEARVRIESRW